jgi:kynurenine 3-monooxygenase
MSNDIIPKVTIVGAGMSGSLLAALLGRRGFRVEVYERHWDGRKDPLQQGRSINMTLCTRGLNALREIGILDQILSLTIPLKGRIVHGEDGRTAFQPYGRKPEEVLYAITRHHLNIAVMNLAEATPNVRLFFNKRCTRIEKSNAATWFQDELTGQAIRVRSDMIIGADGTFSCIRREMQRGEIANFHQQVMDGGYKELAIPAGPNSSFLIEKNALHVWPRRDSLLIAIPNPDGSFTCNLTLPFKGEVSFASLKTPSDVMNFFQSRFPDVIPLIPTLIEEYFRTTVSTFVSIITDPWHYGGRIVLVGDACHSVLPFYGQGMNAAFEDCRVLIECIDRHPDDWEATFAEFESLRKPNTDTLAQLSIQNYFELRDRVRSPWFVARKRVDSLVSRLFPNWYVTLYTLVAHTTIPYREAVEQFSRQKRWMRYTGLEVLLNLAAAVAIILNYLSRILSFAKRARRSNPNDQTSIVEILGARRLESESQKWGN